MKRTKIGQKNMLSNGNKTIPQWCGCKNKNSLKRTKIKSMNTDAVSILKIKKSKISQFKAIHPFLKPTHPDSHPRTKKTMVKAYNIIMLS
jgi:hypothetical protein